jgi:hypothetical protein
MYNGPRLKEVAMNQDRIKTNITQTFEFSETRAQKCELAQQNSENMANLA